MCLVLESGVAEQATVALPVVVGEGEVAVAAKTLGDDEVVWFVAGDGVLPVCGQGPGVQKDDCADEQTEADGQRSILVA
jgi:hypothetical protein